jgi:hypothetical protein
MKRLVLAIFALATILSLGIAPVHAQTLNCVPNPHLCGFPDATNTGVPSGTTLTTSAGFTASTNGVTYDKLDISGQVVVTADNVTLKRSRVRTTTTWPVKVTGKNFLLVDSEVDGQNADDGACIAWNGFTALRDNLHGCGDGVRIGNNSDAPITVQDTYIHALSTATTLNGHQQNVSSFGEAGGATIEHSTLLLTGKPTAAVFLKGDQSSMTGAVTVKESLLDGGTYTIQNLNGNCCNAVASLTLTGNHLGEGFIFGFSNLDPNPVQSGNIDDVTGAALTL